MFQKRLDFLQAKRWFFCCFEALYFGYFLSFYTMQLEPPKTRRTPRRQRDVPVSPGGCAAVLARVPSFGRNPRCSPDFLAYPVPKACMHVLGTGVSRPLGVASSASSPKAAQALGCSLTPGLRISYGRVTCMARAAPVPGLWTLGFLLLCGVCA